MSHVDEGALHAYLDGALDEYPAADAAEIRAHLETCGHCAERLEEERRIRADAHDLLGLAAPDVAVPDFEELRAYVARTRAAPGGMSGRAFRLRWAASIALALGTGWLLRGGLPGVTDRGLPGSLERFEAEEATRVERPATEPSELAEGAAASPSTRATATAERVLEPDAIVATPEERGAGAAALLAEEAYEDAEAPAPPVEAPRPVDAASRLGQDPVSSPSEAARRASAEVAVPAAQLGRQIVEAPTEPVAVTEGLRVMDTNVVVAAPVSADDRPGGDTVASPARADEAGPEEESARSRAAAPVVSALERDAFAARRPVDEDEVPDPGEPSLVVPGYDVVSVTNLGQGTQYTGVHVIQRLPDGSMLEIFHLEPEAERSVVPAAAEGVNEVALRTESGWIVMRGAIPESELDAMLSALFPTG